MCDILLVDTSNLGPTLHRLATIHSWQTDRRTDDRTIDGYAAVARQKYTDAVGLLWLRK